MGEKTTPGSDATMTFCSYSHQLRSGRPASWPGQGCLCGNASGLRFLQSSFKQPSGVNGFFLRGGLRYGKCTSR
jgi:hypothetical protein